MPIRLERPTEVLFYGVKKPTLSPEAKRSADKLISNTWRLIAANKEYLFDEWCITNMDLALMPNRLVLNGDAVPDNLTNYIAQQWQRPSMKLWVKLKRTAL